LRRVLILTYHFPPSAASGSFRMLGFARHLPSHGWRPVVVAPPSLPWEPVDPDLAGRVPPEAVVYRVPYRSGRLARRVALFASWLPAALPTCRKAAREQKPDVVLTSGPPHEVHWLGLWLKRRYGLPWVADFRDPWYPVWRLEAGRGVTRALIRAQEALVVHGADAVIANAPAACRAFRDTYPRLRRRFVTLPNGYDREAFEPLATARPPRAPGEPVRIVHAGAVYFGRDPRPLLDAVKAVSVTGVPGVEVRFFGPPSESGLDLAREAEDRGLGGRVVVGGQVPYARALREMAAADINVLLDSPGRTVGVPAKLYEYIGAGRPVLALGEPGGDLAWVLERSGLPYRVVLPGDQTGIARALEGLVGELDTPARPSRDHFSRAAITGRLAALFERCIRRAAGGAGQGGPSPATEPGEASDAEGPYASAGGSRWT
jgi:glycosyltransferase involved in cell wall biosynthesis